LQFVSLTQPHVPLAKQWFPFSTPQLLHIPPSTPQESVDVPGSQKPTPSQQPPLHSSGVDPSSPPHRVPQTWLSWQVVYAGQSLGVLQPHFPVERHMVPFLLPEQSTHAVLEPH
jgi:hypothetical protein